MQYNVQYSFSLVAGYEREVDVSIEENLLWTSKIVESVDIPVMADAEDGYGEPENIRYDNKIQGNREAIQT